MRPYSILNESATLRRLTITPTAATLNPHIGVSAILKPLSRTQLMLQMKIRGNRKGFERPQLDILEMISGDDVVDMRDVFDVMEPNESGKKSIRVYCTNTCISSRLVKVCRGVFRV